VFTKLTNILYNTKADGTTGYSTWNQNNSDLSDQLQTLNLDTSLSYTCGYTNTLAVVTHAEGFLTASEGAGSTEVTTDQRGYYRNTSDSKTVTRGAYQYKGVFAKKGTSTS
jgi:hypothetical protein